MRHKQQRRCLQLTAKALLLTAKSETDFESFFFSIDMSLRHVRKPEHFSDVELRFFKRIDGIQSVQKYARIIT